METGLSYAFALIAFFEKNEKSETTKIGTIKLIRQLFAFGLAEAKNIADYFYYKFNYVNNEKITWEHINKLLSFCDELRSGNFTYEDGKFYITVKKEIEL